MSVTSGIQPVFCRAEGLVLRRIPLGEADLGVEVLTGPHGLVKLVTRGIRKSRRRSPLPLEPGALTRFEWYHHKKEWLSIRGQELVLVPETLRRDWKGLVILSYFLDLFHRFCAPGHSEEGIFQVAAGCWRYLAEIESPGQIPPMLPVFVKIRLLALAGLWPDMELCSVCGRPNESFLWPVPYESIVCRHCVGDEFPVGHRAGPGQPEEGGDTLVLRGATREFLARAARQKFSRLEKDFSTGSDGPDAPDWLRLDSALNRLVEGFAGENQKLSRQFYTVFPWGGPGP